MNIDIKWDQWLSEAERDDLKNMVETISQQNQIVHDERNSLYKTFNFWVELQTTNAIRDGRITRTQAVRMYERLSNKIVDTCMDTIPAPKE